jgi:hypothetical protein
MDLALGRGAWDRERGAFPPWRQENCLLEPTKTDPKQYNILSRPPLASFYTWGGANPVHGIFYLPGLFAGAVFAIIGGSLYKDGVSLGAIDGTGPAWFAAGNGELCCGRGKTAYSYNGTNLAGIAFPDGADVRSGNWMARRFIFVRKGSGRFYWSDLDDGRTIDGLSFATAESAQDELRDIRKTGDLFWMLGVDSGEAWVLTGDPDLPWSKVSQRTLNRGVQDTGCAEEIEGTVYFISSDGMVCVIQDAAVRISDTALEEKIRTSTGGTTFWFQYEGKPILCLRLDSGTYGLDLALDNQPVTFSTSGRTHWAPKCATMIGSEPLFGDDTTGVIWSFDEESTTDSGQVEFPRVFSAGSLGTGIRIANVIVDGNSGSTAAMTGANADPVLEMRYSRDGGRSFQPWRGARWGQMGEYRRKARFGSCGQFEAPGFLAEFRMLACCPLRVANARANEKLAGRGWK